MKEEIIIEKNNTIINLNFTKEEQEILEEVTNIFRDICFECEDYYSDNAKFHSDKTSDIIKYNNLEMVKYLLYKRLDFKKGLRIEKE